MTQSFSNFFFYLEAYVVYSFHSNIFFILQIVTEEDGISISKMEILNEWIVQCPKHPPLLMIIPNITDNKVPGEVTQPALNPLTEAEI